MFKPRSAFTLAATVALLAVMAPGQPLLLVPMSWPPL